MLTYFAGCATLALLLNNRISLKLKPITPDTTPIFGALYLIPDENKDEVLNYPLSEKLANPSINLVIVQESSIALYSRLKELLAMEGFYYATHSNLDNECISTAVFSRHPLGKKTLTLDCDVADFVGTIKLQNTQAVRFLSVRLPKPGQEINYKDYLDKLDELASFTKEFETPVLALGNYQSVSWSKAIHQFCKNSNLEDSWPGTPCRSLMHNYDLFPESQTANIFHSDHFKCISFEPINIPGYFSGVQATYQFHELEDQDTNKNIKSSNKEF
ncbi:MAG TPA: hypothetical protein PKA00_04245 [Saprospiraceae bacterium]|nr:hypothetical protein [Saprospiraceae bacterium]HMQ82089.1 hypothetical protein [Saprospiraceae bacterium]